MNVCFNFVILVLNIIHCILSSKVTWLPSASFNTPKSFKNGKLPCSKQTVIFPESMINSILINADISISQLILPTEGELVFGNAEIVFGTKDESNCTDEGNVFFLEKSTSSWADPDVWGSPKFNEATPDAERVPCFEDVVEFPVHAQFTIALPDETQTVREIRIGEKKFVNEEELYDYISMESDGSQQFIINYYSDLGVQIRKENCKSLAGCPCQEEVLKVDCSSKSCQKPACVDPIQPIGHCCKICGGAIVFGIDQSFDLLSFKELVDSIVTSYGKERLVYHIGRLTSDRVQVVVVDKGDYSGSSAVVINAINHQMEKRMIHETLMSGSPLDKAGLGGNIFISMFFIVIVVMGAIYLYYYKVPEIRFPLTSTGMLRFNQRTESIVSLTRRDSGVGISSGASRASFRNPLYDSKRQRVIVEESAIED